MNSVARLLATLALVAMFVALCGCNNRLAEVSGRVTVRGTPVTDAIVYYIPSSGPQAQSLLGSNGEYELVTPGKGSGVAPGTYRVYFAPTASSEDEAAKESLTKADYMAGKLPKISKLPPKSILPVKYCSIATSNLKQEVKAGSNTLNLDLDK